MRKKLSAQWSALAFAASFTALSGMTLSAVVQPAHAQSLNDVLATAYRTNPTVRAARSEFRATEELKAQALAGALPQITAQASYGNTDSTSTNNFGGVPVERSDDFEPRTYGVSAEQPVFTGFRNYNSIRQARARVEAGGAQLVSVEQQILQSAATAYFDVLRDVKVYDANLANVKVLLRQLEEAQLRFDVGEITKTDVAQAQARLAGARAQLANSQAQLAVSRASYKEIVGEMPGTLDPSPALPVMPESQEEAERYAMIYAPSIIGSKASEKASRKQIAIAQGALAPSVSLTASYRYSEEQSAFTQQDETLAYGAQASVPIFQGGLNYSRIREARALNAADRQRITEAERGAVRAATTSWEQLIAARATKRSASAQVDANRLALEGVRRENQVGTRTTLDVLNAEQELLNATVSLANAERDERAASFSLLAATGLLTLEAVGIEIQEDDANTHREKD